MIKKWALEQIEKAEQAAKQTPNPVDDAIWGFLRLVVEVFF